MISRKTFFGKLGITIVGSLIGLLMVEGALRVADQSSDSPTVPELVPDERLGFRPKPGYPGHDSRGWYNDSQPGQADIVVLGDSLVYGKVWPRAVGARLHQTVYQMAAGGYGPAQYAVLLEDALKLSPKVVIATLDFSDDFMDAYQFTYRVGDFKSLPPEPIHEESVVSRHQAAQVAIARAEGIDPDFLRLRYVDCRKPVDAPDSRLQAVHDVLSLPPLAPLSQPPGWQEALTVAARYSALARTVNNRLAVDQKSAAESVESWERICAAYEDGRLKSRFNPAYRLLRLDDTDPRIAEGKRIAMQAYRYMARRCPKADCSFYVVWVPTKETAFRIRTMPALGSQPYMSGLWNAEADARASAQAFLLSEHIATIDTLPLMEKLIASDVNPYSTDADGHPSELGYEAIARAIADRLERDRLAAGRAAS